MRKSHGIFIVSIIFTIGAAFVACNKTAYSTPEFIYKKSPDGSLAFKTGDISVTQDEFMQGIEGALYTARMRVHDLKMERLRAILLDKMIERDPNKKDLTKEQFFEKYVTTDIAVSDKEIEDFVKERQIPEASVNDTLKDRIKSFLEANKEKKAVEKWLDGLLAKNPIEIYFEKPQRPVFNVEIGDAPFSGGVGAKVTIVEFSDFQCPYCAQGSKRLEEVKKKYGNRVKVVFKNFPLPSHPDAFLAAEAGLCAQEMEGNGAFWRLHDALFANQSNLQKSELIRHAKSVGLDEKTFTECLDSRKFRQKVEADKMQGTALNIRSTPTFFINGQLLEGAGELKDFAEIIDEELKK